MEDYRYKSGYACMRGDVDNLMLSWSGSFAIKDSRGRNWICAPVEADQDILDGACKEIEEAQDILLKAGFETEGLQFVMIFNFQPSDYTYEADIEDLKNQLGEKPDKAAD